MRSPRLQGCEQEPEKRSASGMRLLAIRIEFVFELKNLS